VFARAVCDLARNDDIQVDLAGSREIINYVCASGVSIETTIEVPTQALRLSALSLLDPRRLRTVRRALSGGAWDVAFVNLPSGEYGGTPLAEGMFGGVPSVGLLHVHQPLSSLPFRFGRMRERIARASLRRTTRLCVLSRWAAEQTSEGWGIPRSNIDIMPIIRPVVVNVDPRAGRRRLGLPDGILVGIAGRVSFAQKGHDLLLCAAEVLRRGEPAIHFVVAGEGPDSKLLRSEIARRSLDDSFVLLGHVECIDTFLSAMDAIVIPSRFEGLPLIALEALWSSTPGVAARIDGLTQIWPERWLVEPDDPDALAAGLRSLLRTPAAERADTMAQTRAQVAELTTSDLSPFLRAVLGAAVAQGAS
jgi:glycosyltransferase involved in cell wall biosynthesis